MRPALSWRTAFGGRADVPVEEVLDLRLPRIAVDHVGELAREWRQSRLAQEGIEGCAGGRTAGRTGGVLLRRRADHRGGKSQGCRRCGGVEFFRTEFFEQHQLLSERLSAEQRAGLAIGGVVETGLHRGRQDVFLACGVAAAFDAIGQIEGVFVGLRQGQDGVQRGRFVDGFVVIRRRVGGFGLSFVIDGAGTKTGCSQRHRQKDAQRRQETEPLEGEPRSTVHHQPPRSHEGVLVICKELAIFVTIFYKGLRPDKTVAYQHQCAMIGTQLGKDTRYRGTFTPVFR
ncbi:hypothetical protein D3C84_710910 [compost metagenome]